MFRTYGHVLRRLVELFTGAYALGLLLFLVLRLVLGDGLWWLALLGNFTPWYFAALIVLLPLALLSRAKRPALMLLPLALLGLLWFGRLYLPKAQADAGDAPTLNVISFNVWGDNQNLTDVEDWLREMQADVVAIIELPQAWADGFPALQDAYPEQFVLSELGGVSWDSAILSKYPILSAEAFYLGDIPQARVVVNVNGQEVVVYGIHLYVPSGRIPHAPLSVYNDAPRDAQIRNLIERVKAETLPYVVAGDFNMSDQSLVYNELAAVMRDSFREAGTGLGTSWFHAQRFGLPSLIPPLVRIDYIWHSAGFRAISAALGPYLGSDHLPVYATLALT